MSAWLFTSVIVLATGIALCNKELARGWGDAIAWTDLESGLQKAKESNKPLMLVIHKSWCGACKSLKPKFAGSTKIAELSENFIMVNALDDEEPKEAKYAPDGGYIPRIFFLTPEGEVMNDMVNEQGYEQYKYFHSNADSIVLSMKKVIDGLSGSVVRDDL